MKVYAICWIKGTPLWTFMWQLSRKFWTTNYHLTLNDCVLVDICLFQDSIVVVKVSPSLRMFWMWSDGQAANMKVLLCGANLIFYMSNTSFHVNFNFSQRSYWFHIPFISQYLMQVSICSIFMFYIEIM